MTRCQWTLKLSYYFPLVFISLSYTNIFCIFARNSDLTWFCCFYFKLSINIIRLTQAHRTILQDAHDCGYCANAHTNWYPCFHPFIPPSFSLLTGESSWSYCTRRGWRKILSARRRQMRCYSFVAGNEKLSSHQFFSNINQVPSQN